METMTVTQPAEEDSPTPSHLIGQVAALYLHNRLVGEERDGSTARYIVDQLTGEQTAAVAQAILNDADVSDQIEIKLPRHLMTPFMDAFELPDGVLTTERATFFRNAQCDKSALLLANTGDDEAQSLQLIEPIGAAQLMAQPELWVRVASRGLILTEGADLHWERALRGLMELNLRSLDRIADYILRTRREIEVEGRPLVNALGAALPAIAIPRDTTYFVALPERFRSQASRWKRLFSDADRKRAPYLRKQTPSQLLLNTAELRASFNKVKDAIIDASHDTIEAFIEAPSGWNPQAQALAECEWEDIKPLFDGLKREKLNLGQITKLFYDDREPELLSESDHDYLNRLTMRRSSQAEEEDQQFYESHRNELKEDRKLKSAWDKFVFGSPKETDDFVAGVALSLERLFARDENSTNRRLRIALDGRSKKDLKDLNVDAGLYFSARYKGLKGLFGKNVRWETGKLFDFPDLVQEWRRSPKNSLNHSNAKAALQLKFTLELEVQLPNGGSDLYATQLIWKFEPNKVTSEFALDWKRLTNQPLVYCTASREPVSAKGQFQAVNLYDVRTLVPVYDRARGSFVASYKAANNLGVDWQNNLQEARSQGLISEDVRRRLNDKWTLFRESYASAIQGFWNEGFASEHLLEQAELWADLLVTICREAKGDRNRELLLRPLLRIGSVSLAGGPPAEIIAPWHPLRLAAMTIKTLHVSSLLQHFLISADVRFGDTGRLFFKDLREDLIHPFYPEVALSWNSGKPELLALSDTCGDYTLHEPPRVADFGQDETSENPTEASRCVADLVDRYLALHPHEGANLSVVLYNCDSARLPQAVVDKIGAQYEDDDEVRCQIVLRHRDPRKLRYLYERIVESADAEVDAFNASEATRDFMARLRIGISADQAPPPNAKDGCPNDIVFSQDVIARHAQVEWFSENARAVSVSTLVPSRWSRRRPAARDDLKSVVYLCCPAQTSEGWAYLTAITTFVKGDWDNVEERRLLPARQLDFQDTKMEQIFRETHNLGNWVVNYDELLDRRQLLNQQVRVIRYKQSATQGRNLIISSTAPLGLLRSMVRSRVQSLLLGLSNDEERTLTEYFISDANDVSGDIVLRAAKRGRNASELMGIVLSRFLLRYEIGIERYFGWYFLDDYADWLGQREEQIADILMLSPDQSETGKLRLAVIVAESKYIDHGGLNSGRRNSAKQLRDTLKRINDAIFGAPERLDRSLWLGRLSDLILDGVQFPASAGINLSDWRRAIREGECDIWVRGYSHVFISGPSEAPDCADFTSIAEMDDGYQEVFGLSQVRDLVLKYFRREDPMPLRQANAQSGGDPSIWTEQTYRRPTDLVEIILPRGRKASADQPGPQNTLVEVATNLNATIAEVPMELSTVAQASGNGTARNFVSAVVTESGHTTNGTSQGPEAATATTMEHNSVANGSSGEDTVPTLWAFPVIGNLLAAREIMEASHQEGEAWLETVKSRAKAALQSFSLQAKLLDAKLTPNAALLKWQGSANLTTDQVERRRKEFLTTHGLNIVSIQPEPGVVSLSIERPQRDIVRLEDLWARWQVERTTSGDSGNQELLIGTRESDGSLLFLSPRVHAPHTLIAGSTGSGKSVLMQNIILGLAATNTPTQVRMLLIDPKQGVDYFAFDSLPHLQGGIIDNQQIALDRLSDLVTEMDNRYRRFREARTPNLSAYNCKVSAEAQLPVIWVIHDEFAEWMLVDEYKEQVTAIVSRLGVKARAAGIYLVFAAQRPDSNVMPMQLRANLGNRLILRVDSEGTSEIALGEKGAELLLGKGHLLARLESESNLIYAQVPFVSENAMERIVEAIR